MVIAKGVAQGSIFYTVLGDASLSLLITSLQKWHWNLKSHFLHLYKLNINHYEWGEVAGSFTLCGIALLISVGLKPLLSPREEASWDLWSNRRCSGKLDGWRRRGWASLMGESALWKKTGQRRKLLRLPRVFYIMAAQGYWCPTIPLGCRDLGM